MVLSSAKSFSRKNVQRVLLRNKDLDFLILTGCSCLITLLHHPMMNHLQGHNSAGSSNAQPASTASHNSSSSRTSPNSFGNYSAIAPKRQSFTIEDEEA